MEGFLIDPSELLAGVAKAVVDDEDEVDEVSGNRRASTGIVSRGAESSASSAKGSSIPRRGACHWRYHRLVILLDCWKSRGRRMSKRENFLTVTARAWHIICNICNFDRLVGIIRIGNIEGIHVSVTRWLTCIAGAARGNRVRLA